MIGPQGYLGLECHLAATVALDLVVGDPRWLPHPVRGIGWLAARLETVTRRLLPWPRLAGMVCALAVVGVSGACAYGAMVLAAMAHPAAVDVVSITLIYWTIAARDLARHATAVHRALEADDLPEARRRVGMMVSRETTDLDEPGVVRACVESVAENIVDGVTAPLLFAAVGGPVGAVVYRAINTLDSMFGYKNERYAAFGWASARLDDVANAIPARLTAPLVCLLSPLVGGSALRAWRIVWRDARQHASPNSGFPEAAVAGAFGVQLGGTNVYFGRPVPKPTIGDPVAGLTRTHILRTSALALLTSVGFLIACLAVLRAVAVLCPALR